jgi:hypothetical protein
MPPVAGVNVFATTRPGATVAAEALREDRSVPLYLEHRFGEGRTALLATATTWLWKMESDANDGRHTRLWRRLLRDLAKDAPPPIVLRSRRALYPERSSETLEFHVRDRDYEPREGLRVDLEITSPSGAKLRPPIDESIQQPGIYHAFWTPREAGPHALTLSASTEDNLPVGALEDRLFVGPDLREFRGARPDAAYLAEIARRSGGAVLPLNELAAVVDKLAWRPPPAHQALRFRLWHLPVFYVLLVSMLCLEWYLRRKKGFA